MKIILLIFCLLNLKDIGLHGFYKMSKKIQDGDIKLIDGGSKTEGTVLVYLGYGWGAICDDHWTILEANVVCNQLGMEKAIAFYTKNFFNTYGISKITLIYCIKIMINVRFKSNLLFSIIKQNKVEIK